MERWCARCQGEAVIHSINHDLPLQSPTRPTTSHLCTELTHNLPVGGDSKIYIILVCTNQDYVALQQGLSFSSWPRAPDRHCCVTNGFSLSALWRYLFTPHCLFPLFTVTFRSIWQILRAAWLESECMLFLLFFCLFLSLSHLKLLGPRHRQTQELAVFSSFHQKNQEV